MATLFSNAAFWLLDSITDNISDKIHEPDHHKRGGPPQAPSVDVQYPRTMSQVKALERT